MLGIHHYLRRRFLRYHRWHQRPFHEHIHWSALGFFVFGFGVVLGLLGWSGFNDTNGGILSVRIPPVHAFAGSTFEERKTAYLNSQGDVWAWLENNTNPQGVSDYIDFITGPGWYIGALPGANPVGRLYYQYYQDPATRKISDADATKLMEKLEYDIGIGPANGAIDSSWCGVANWHWPKLVGAYLFNWRVKSMGQLSYPQPLDDPSCPVASFSMNGTTYTRGQSYDAKILLRDYLEHEMDDLLKNGTEEDFGTYYHYQIKSILLLHDFAPDQRIKDKAKMLMDWMVLQHSIGLSANHVGGGHGRNYTQGEYGDGREPFPFGILYNIDPDTISSSNAGTEWYVSSYRQPGIFEHIVEKINGPAQSEGDDYYRIIRGRTSSLGNRYLYLTPLYNLGGADGGKGFGIGWELNVKNNDSRIEMYSCDIPFNGTPNNTSDDRACNAPCAYYRSDGVTCWMWYLLELGQRGSQHRNALIAEGAVNIHEILEGQSWDAVTSANNWTFYQKGNVVVATQAGGGSRAFEVTTIGVDYPSLSAFQSAMSGALISGTSFTTSKGLVVNNGYVDRNSGAPFQRLEAWEGNVGANNEKQFVSWSNNVMTVTQSSQSCVYDFNTWSTSGNGCGGNVGPQCTTMGSWQNQGCGKGTCTASLMQQTRIVDPQGCSVTNRCVADVLCGGVGNQPPNKPTLTNCPNGSCS